MYNHFIREFLDVGECNELINRGLNSNLESMKSSKFVGGKLIQEEELDENINKRKGSYIEGEGLNEDIFKKLTNKLIRLTNELKIFNGISYIDVPKYSFNLYNVGDFLYWHKDNHEILFGATLTIIIQLNEDYIGGDILYEIDNKEYSLPKSRGSIFLLDPNINHSISEVEEGTRFSINAWPIKKIKKELL
jgi:Rps23 Pro-64 3,4-dihydroxylase Tpa1-like proline 4-hydroxylase